MAMIKLVIYLCGEPYNYRMAFLVNFRGGCIGTPPTPLWLWACQVPAQNLESCKQQILANTSKWWDKYCCHRTGLLQLAQVLWVFSMLRVWRLLLEHVVPVRLLCEPWSVGGLVSAFMLVLCLQVPVELSWLVKFSYMKEWQCYCKLAAFLYSYLLLQLLIVYWSLSRESLFWRAFSLFWMSMFFSRSFSRISASFSWSSHSLVESSTCRWILQLTRE